MNTMIRIRCGHCKGEHPTVQDVRACAGTNTLSTKPPVLVPQTPRPAFTPNSPDLKAVTAEARRKVRHGRYALKDYDTGEIRFYQVDTPTEGRWRGYVFVKQLVGSPGNYRQIRLSLETVRKVLLRLIAGHKEAMLLYGKESQICGRCNSPLTDKKSRELGIGPVCRAKLNRQDGG